MEFGGLLGNEALRERLCAAAAQGRLSHCYAICGPAGSGRRTLATAIAAALQCAGTDPPCGRCPACRKVFAGVHPDVVTCVDEKHKLFGVDLARSVSADACLKPNEGRSKVYLFPQELNPQAQNALLKLIEEPPPYAAFLFLALSADRLLPTVRSRCQELRLSPLDGPTLSRALRERCPGRSEDEYRAAMRQSGGWLGQALDALESARLTERAAAFAGAFADQNKPALLELLTGMEKLSRDDFCAELQTWRQLLHDALLCQAGLPGSAQAAAIAKARSGAQLAGAMDVLAKYGDYAQSNVGVGHLCGALRALI